MKIENTGMRAEVTFILPTLNRRQWVKRALDSCLACENGIVKPHVVVIDSESGDGTMPYLRAAYASDERVTLHENSRSAGCIRSWFDGVEQLKTRFATFVWDDDVLSPFFADMVTRMMREGAEFSAGFGEVSPIDQVYQFEPIDNFRSVAASEVLLGFFGFHGRSELPRLPVSPICCMVTSDLLRDWVKQVEIFTSRNSLRRHFMIKRAIGPDLMVYLSALVKETGHVVVTPSVVAQFSSHPGSITIKANAFDIEVGYWLAKLWAFERISDQGRRHEATCCAAYLLVYGARLILIRLWMLRLSWVLDVAREVWQVLRRLAQMRLISATCTKLVALAGDRLLPGGGRRSSR